MAERATIAGADQATVPLAASAAELRAALAARQFVLHYQPKVELENDTCRSAEALIRWVHPERGLVFPDLFIPLAERSGVIGELTHWVVRQAVRQRREWQDQGVHVVVSVNLSPQSLTDDSIIEVASTALERNGVPARALELELTETAVMEDPGVALTTLTRLAALGIASAIDDFGTGFSSLVYLRELPVATIKIDKSFVMHMDTSDRDTAIVRSTIGLARSLGKRVVAEGVENRRSADLLREFGCHTGQGYLWSRPVPPEEFVRWLAGFRTASPAIRIVAAGRRGDRRAAALMAANHALLRARRASDVQAALVCLVEDLGGTVESADLEAPGALHLDLSLGEGEAVVPVADPGSLARRLLEQALPQALADAEIAMERFRGRVA